MSLSINKLPRIIPVLLLKNNGLIKTKKFKEYKYVGDFINAVRIFNEKQTDELIFLDIQATILNKPPDLTKISQIAEECFMPVTYGGGIRTLEQIKAIIQAGIEKVCINSYFFENPDFVKQASDTFGSSTIVVSIDVKKNIWGQQYCYTHSGTKKTNLTPVEAAQLAEKMGAGEILVNSIDRDGTKTGYDLQLIKEITSAVSIPVIACGGASSYEDLAIVIKEAKASAAAAGSLFVFYGKYDAVLINYPSPEDIRRLFPEIEEYV